MRLDLVEMFEESVDDALQVGSFASLRYQCHIGILDHARECASQRFSVEADFSCFHQQWIAGEVLLVVPAVPELGRDLVRGGFVELAKFWIQAGFYGALAQQ